MTNYEIIASEYDKKAVDFPTESKPIALTYINKIILKSKKEIVDKYYVPTIEAKPRY